MSEIPRLPLVIAVVVILTMTATPGRTEPASSPQSAWTNSTLRSDADLKDPLIRRGKEVFQARCAACHGVDPKLNAPGGPRGLPDMPGTSALAMKYKGAKPAALEERTDLTADFVAVFVRKGVGIMPPFRPTEVSNEDLKALGSYLARQRP